MSGEGAITKARNAAKRVELLKVNADTQETVDALQYEADLRSELDEVAAFSLLSLAETAREIADTLKRVGMRV